MYGKTTKFMSNIENDIAPNLSDDCDHDSDVLEPSDLEDLTPEEVDIDELLKEHLELPPLAESGEENHEDVKWYVDSDEEEDGQDEDQDVYVFCDFLTSYAQTWMT